MCARVPRSVLSIAPETSQKDSCPGSANPSAKAAPAQPRCRILVACTLNPRTSPEDHFLGPQTPKQEVHLQGVLQHSYIWPEVSSDTCQVFVVGCAPFVFSGLEPLGIRCSCLRSLISSGSCDWQLSGVVSGWALREAECPMKEFEQCAEEHLLPSEKILGRMVQGFRVPRSPVPRERFK